MILVHVFRVKLNYKFRGGLLGLTFAMGAQITSGQPPPTKRTKDIFLLSFLVLRPRCKIHIFPVSVTICSG